MNQASLPSPRTWSANDLVSVPRLRADAVNAIAFLLTRPAFAGQNTLGSSWSSGSDNTLGMNSELTDNWNGHVASSSGNAVTSQYWAPVPGWYLCRSAPAWAYTSTTPAVFAGGMQGITGGASWGPQRGPLTLCGSGSQPVTQAVDLIEMTNSGPPGGSGDWVQWTAFQSTGSPVSLSTASVQLPTASARWVCAISGTQPLPVPPLAAVPSPITHAWLNSNLRDTINYLIYPPVCRAIGLPGGQTLASTSWPAGSAVPFNGSTVDNYGGLNTSTGAYTVPLSGRYYVYGQFTLANSSVSTGYGCGISVSGATTQWGDVVYFAPASSVGGGACVSRRLRLTAGQTIALVANQGSGGSIAYSTSGTNPTRMIIVWEGI